MVIRFDGGADMLLELAEIAKRGEYVIENPTMATTLADALKTCVQYVWKWLEVTGCIATNYSFIISCTCYGFTGSKKAFKYPIVLFIITIILLCFGSVIC
jgi:hypothetical protein